MNKQIEFPNLLDFASEEAALDEHVAAQAEHNTAQAWGMDKQCWNSSELTLNSYKIPAFQLLVTKCIDIIGLLSLRL